MLTEIADFLGGLTWRRASAAFVMLLVAGLLLSFYESVTHNIALERAQKAVDLAASAEAYYKQLQNTMPTTEQMQIYLKATSIAHEAIESTGPAVDLQVRYLKFLAAFLPWLLMAFVYIGGNESGYLVGVFGSLVIGLPVAAAMSFVPDFLWPWGNLALLPIVPFALLMLTFFLLQRGKSKRGT